MPNTFLNVLAVKQEFKSLTVALRCQSCLATGYLLDSVINSLLRKPSFGHPFLSTHFVLGQKEIGTSLEGGRISYLLGWLETTPEEVSLAVSPMHAHWDWTPAGALLKNTQDFKYYRRETGSNPSFPLLSEHEVRHTRQYGQPPILSVLLKGTTGG